jgi:hypothetical protein
VYTKQEDLRDLVVMFFFDVMLTNSGKNHSRGSQEKVEFC